MNEDAETVFKDTEVNPEVNELFQEVKATRVGAEDLLISLRSEILNLETSKESRFDLVVMVNNAVEAMGDLRMNYLSGEPVVNSNWQVHTDVRELLSKVSNLLTATVHNDMVEIEEAINQLRDAFTSGAVTLYNWDLLEVKNSSSNLDNASSLEVENNSYYVFPGHPTYQEWKDLIGLTITDVRYLRPEETQGVFLNEESVGGVVGLILSDGSFLIPSQDEEGNGAGEFFIVRREKA